MLRNMIFDMGNVLIRFDPAYFIRRLGVEREEDRRLLLNEVFRSPDWAKLDSGELTEPEMDVRVRERLPRRLHGAAHELIFAWDEPIESIAGMAELAADCKRAGLGVYLLSNASLRQREYWPRIPGHEAFDGCVISAELRCVKPSEKIYKYLLDTFRLRAEECLFVDDVQRNVDGAERVGIPGFLFTGSADELRGAIRARGVDL